MEGEMVIQSVPEISSRSWFSIWFDVLTKPKEQTFQNLLIEENRTIARSFSWLFIAHVGSRLAILGYAILSGQKIDSSYFQHSVTITLLSLLIIVLETFLFHFLSHIFKGERSIKDILLKFSAPDLLSPEIKGSGQFKDLLFIYAAYQAPLNILFVIMSTIPAGECVSFLISLYVMVLSVLALKSLYGISTVKAGIVVFISSMVAIIPFNILALSLLRI
jgi:hypothetical protein